MTVLDDIIDASTDSTVAASDLLRMVQVAAHRLGAANVVTWAKRELAGYEDEAALPEYRHLKTNVVGTFAGPMRTFEPHMLTVLPPSMDKWWMVDLRQPLVELQGYAEADEDPTREWPAGVVAEFENSGAFRLELMALFSARNIITRQSLRGVLDVIRSKALELALELQSTDPAAGSIDGPTVKSEPQLATAVFNVTNNIYGDGANIASGTNIDQRSRVTKGDATSLRTEVQALGLTTADVEEFVSAVVEEQSVEKSKVKAFLQRLRSGALTITGGIATEAVAGTLVELAKAYLGLPM